MTELALRTEALPALASEHHGANDLMQWAHGVSAASEIVKALWGSPFIPQQYVIRDGREIDLSASLAACTAAIVTGAAVGLDPLASLRSIDVIQGTPAFRAVALRGIAQSNGHETWVVESNSSRCIMSGRRRGSTHVETVKWDLDRAQKMGLTGKQQWKSQPGNMLIARATAEIVRLIAADAILGLPYSAEELGDGEIVEPTVEPTAAPAKRTARRAPVQPVQETAAEIAFEPEPDQPVADPPADLLTPAQSRKMHAQFQEAQLDRDAGLNFVAELIGHPVESTKGLTKAEAAKVIDALAKELGDDDALLEDPFPSDRGAE